MGADRVAPLDYGTLLSTPPQSEKTSQFYRSCPLNRNKICAFKIEKLSQWVLLLDIRTTSTTIARIVLNESAVALLVSSVAQNYNICKYLWVNISLVCKQKYSLFFIVFI